MRVLAGSPLRELTEILNGEPADVIFNLGREVGTGMLITLIDGEDRVIHRLNSSPRFRTYKRNDEKLLDVTGLDEDTGRFAHTGLRYQKADFKPAKYSQGDLGSAEIHIGEDGMIGLAHYERTA